MHEVPVYPFDSWIVFAGQAAHDRSAAAVPARLTYCPAGQVRQPVQLRAVVFDWTWNEPPGQALQFVSVWRVGGVEM